MSARTRISRAGKPTAGADVYLVDTDVISEARKGNQGNAGVRAFFFPSESGRGRALPFGRNDRRAPARRRENSPSGR